MLRLTSSCNKIKSREHAGLVLKYYHPDLYLRTEVVAQNTVMLLALVLDLDTVIHLGVEILGSIDSRSTHIAMHEHIASLCSLFKSDHSASYNATEEGSFMLQKNCDRSITADYEERAVPSTARTILKELSVLKIEAH